MYCLYPFRKSCQVNTCMTNNFLTRFIKRVFLCLGYTIPITYSLILCYFLFRNPGGSGPPVNDKFAHLVSFAIFSTSWYWAFDAKKISKVTLKAISYTIAFAVTTEIIQHVLPYRSFELYDILADSIGGIIGVAICCLLNRK